MPELNLRPGIYTYIGVCSCRALESAIKMEYGDSRRGRGPSKAVARDCINVRNFVKRERPLWDSLSVSLCLSFFPFFRDLFEERPNCQNNLAVTLTRTDYKISLVTPFVTLFLCTLFHSGSFFNNKNSRRERRKYIILDKRHKIILTWDMNRAHRGNANFSSNNNCEPRSLRCVKSIHWQIIVRNAALKRQ